MAGSPSINWPSSFMELLDAQPSAEPPSRPGGPAPEYRSQRDNRWAAGKSADQQCAATSATMAFLELAESRSTAVAALRNLIQRHNQVPPDTDHPEDLFIALVLAIDWTRAPQRHPHRFLEEHDWRDGFSGGNIIKHPYALAFAASMLPFCDSQPKQMVSARWTASKSQRWDQAVRAHNSGARLIFETGLTSSGHVVMVVDIDEAGVVLHDPYGMAFSGSLYLRNQEAPSSRHSRALAARRCSGDAHVLQLFDQKRAYASWGASNYHSRAEIDQRGGIKWALPFRPRA